MKLDHARVMIVSVVFCMSAMIWDGSQHAVYSQEADEYLDDGEAMVWDAEQGWVHRDTIDWMSVDPLSPVCTEGLCTAFVELAKVMNGQTPNVNWLNQNKGTDDPLDMFNNGGSENITVIVRVALYHWEGPPHNTWLDRYYKLQLDPGYPYFLEDEIFSSVYTQGVVGASIAVRAEAVRRGHTVLRDRASTFLRRYWAFLTLAARDPKPNSWIAHNMHGTIQKPPGSWWGFNLGLVGRRVYANGFDGNSDNVPGYGLQGLLLAMALQESRRSVTADLTASPAYWGGLRAAVEALGYTLDGNGKVNLQSKSIPPEKYGLTAVQRSTLWSFAEGREFNISDVFTILGNQGVDHPISILRHTFTSDSSDRVVSWWGSGPRYSLPGDAKGGPWAIVEATSVLGVPDDLPGPTRFVTRSTEKWGNTGRGETWFDGNQVCAKGALPTFCRPVDAVLYHIVLTREGPNCVFGCQ